MKKIDHFTDFIRRKTGVLRIEIKNKINIRVMFIEDVCMVWIFIS